MTFSQIKCEDGYQDLTCRTWYKSISILPQDLQNYTKGPHFKDESRSLDHDGECHFSLLPPPLQKVLSCVLLSQDIDMNVCIVH